MEQCSRIEKYAMVKWLEFVLQKEIGSFERINGLILIRFIEEISHSKCNYPYPKVIKIPFQSMEAANVLINFCNQLGIGFGGSAEDIFKNDEKMMLAFFTIVAQKYLKLKRTDMEEVTAWIERVTEWKCLNYTNDWVDGRMIKLVLGPEDPLGKMKEFGVVEVVERIEDVGIDELTTMMLVRRLYEKKEKIELYHVQRKDWNEIRQQFDEQRKQDALNYALGITDNKPSPMYTINSPFKKTARKEQNIPEKESIQVKEGINLQNKQEEASPENKSTIHKEPNNKLINQPEESRKDKEDNSNKEMKLVNETEEVRLQKLKEKLEKEKKERRIREQQLFQKEEQRKQEEEQRKQEEERRKQEEERKKQEEERKKQEEERKKQEEEQRKQEEERKRQEEEQRRQEEEQRRQEEEQRKQEEERKKQEEERKKQEEEQRKQEEEDLWLRRLNELADGKKEEKNIVTPEKGIPTKEKIIDIEKIKKPKKDSRIETEDEKRRLKVLELKLHREAEERRKRENGIKDPEPEFDIELSISTCNETKIPSIVSIDKGESKEGLKDNKATQVGEEKKRTSSLDLDTHSDSSSIVNYMSDKSELEKSKSSNSELKISPETETTVITSKEVNCTSPTQKQVIEQKSIGSPRSKSQDLHSINNNNSLSTAQSDNSMSSEPQKDLSEGVDVIKDSDKLLNSGKASHQPTKIIDPIEENKEHPVIKKKSCEQVDVIESNDLNKRTEQGDHLDHEKQERTRQKQEEEQKRIEALREIKRQRQATLEKESEYKQEEIKHINQPFVLDPEHLLSDKASGLMEHYYQTLKSWTGLEKYKIIFNEKITSLTNERINRAVCGQTNIMVIIITTDCYIFGSYNSLKMPNAPQKKYKYLINDPKFFVFSLKAYNSSISPKKFMRKKLGKTSCVWANSQNKVLYSVKRFYKLNKMSNSLITKKFAIEYNDIPEMKHLYFTGSVNFAIGRMIISQWN
ncbi:splicing factor, arginine/serine-rich, putative [Entamoeba dispar SAW760]|uniref:Splicing factor, arginine/serine-rich, putative n=1 Tax=Entamoeba dispar (strain ATCC PRA-260 / SAW760) TaxID=370354 RepID=B0EI56_ENTDS|nr:splicing factor, arginine/serine-rich, putative [Entamoeba dispar SAW760]EDR25778.1 splicing factor, arginine/serine-rich, putative [Entamoeba dispar SAW760]|eukprot:EDR25778.1 splicing factor, arginine/serine-rich, putative [Entamoeba dispar SAW760]